MNEGKVPEEEKLVSYCQHLGKEKIALTLTSWIVQWNCGQL